MKRFAAAAILAIVTSVSAPHAFADQRISFQAYRNLVVMGYGSALTPVISQVSDASSYDWNALKYEVVTDENMSVSASYRVLQSSQVSCSGTLAGTGNLAVCEGGLATGRQVLNGGTAQASIPNSGLTVTGHSSIEFEARITAWLDVNGDGEVSPLEPKSPPALITFIPAKDLGASLNFEVDPPGRHNGGLSGWIYDSSGRESWGRGLSSVLDLSKFVVHVERCVGIESPCTFHSYSPVLVAHPQLQAYRFNMSHEWAGNALTKISLAYQDFPDSFTVLSSRVFDYSGSVPGSAQTEVMATRNSTAPILTRKPKVFERFTYLSDLTSGFTYRARFLDDTGNPLGGEVVDIKIDSTELGNSSALSVDGRSLALSTGDSRDVIWLQRVTNGDGVVEISVSSSLPTLWQSVAIESQIKGQEAHRGGLGGFVERIFWQPSKRTFSLDVSETSVNELSVTAKLSGPVTYGSNTPTVQFVSSKNLIFSDSAARTTGTPTPDSSGSVTAQTRLRVKWSSHGSGREVVKARVNLAGVWYEAEQEIEFNGILGTLKKPSTAASESVSVSPGITTLISSTRGAWKVQIANAAGQVISVKAGGKWYKSQALTNRFVLTRPAKPGTVLSIAVYIGGRLESVSTLTVTR